MALWSQGTMEQWAREAGGLPRRLTCPGVVPVVLLHWALERDLKVKGAIDTKIETRWGSVALLGIWVSA